MKATHFRWLNLLVLLVLLLPAAAGRVQASSLKLSAQPQSAQAPVGNVTLTPVAQAGGSVRAVALQGNYAYIGVGAQFVVVEMTDPSTPLPRGRVNLSSGVIRDITLYGGFAYVAATAGMAMINISDPDLPTIAPPEIALPGNGLALSANGFYAYAVGKDKLSVLNVSSVFPSLMYSSTYTSSSGWEDISVDGSYAYLVGGGELLTLDITDPYSITQLDRRPIPGAIQTRQLSANNGYLYIAACDQGVHIFSLSDPAHPTAAGIANTSGACALGVQTSQTTAYVSAGLSGMQLFDLSAPTNPALSGSYDTPGTAWSAAVTANGYAYLADDDALRSLNVTAPYFTYQAGEYLTHGQADHLVAVDQHVYAMDRMVSGGLRAYDATSPTLPLFQSTLYNPSLAATNLAVLDQNAYYADQSLIALDLSDPAYPAQIGSLTLPFVSRQVAAFASSDGRRYVALAAQAKGLQVAEVSNPENMALVGAATGIDAQGVSVFENRAYVTAGTNGLHIFNLSDPTAPQLLGSIDTAGYAYAVTVLGGMAYVADGANGLQIVDVNNSAAPVLRGRYDTAGEVLDVRVLGRYSFVADGPGGLHILDTSNPDALLWDSSYTLPGEVKSLAIADGYVYVAAGDAGLWVYQANYLPAYLISGKVTNGSGIPIPGVVIFSPATGYLQHTNANGEYLFLHMPTGRHQIRAYKAGYSFTPALYAPTLIDAPVQNQDFSAALLRYNVTGRVTNSTGRPLAGVTVSDGLGNSTTTGTAGDYTLSLPAGAHHYRASLGQSTFWPAERFANIPPGLTEQDFTMPAPIELAAYRYGGMSRIVARQDDLLYMDTGSGLTVLNISSPYTPTLMGKSQPLPGSIEGLALNGRYAYVALNAAGLGILDLSRPTHPTLANLVSLPGEVMGVAVDGGYLYASLNRGLYILDLSNPEKPVFIASLPLSGAGPLALSSGMAYVGTACNGISIVNVSVPAVPVLSRFTPLPGCVQDIAVGTGYAYLALGGSGQNGLHILDTTGTFTLVYSETLSAWGGRLSLDGNFVYYAADGLGLNVYDVSNPFDAIQVGALPLTSPAYELTTNGSAVYLANGYGLSVIDATDRSNPNQAGVYTESFIEEATGISIQGAYAYVAGYMDGLQIYDVSSPHNPILKGRSSDIGGDILTSIAVQGEIAYLGSGESGLHLVDVSNPTRPTLLTTYPVSSISDIAVSGDYAYLTGYTSGLTVVRISDPSAPVLAGTYNAMTGTQAIELAANLAYIVQPTHGLRVIDIGNPANPVEVGFYDPAARALNVHLSNQRLYLATESGLVILDAANLNAPPLGLFKTSSPVYDVRVLGNFAYLAMPGGLLAVNISNPQRMVEAGFIPGADAWDGHLALRGKDLYMAHPHAGLLVYNLSGPRPLKVLPGGGANNAPQTITVTGANFQLGAQAFLGDRLLDAVTVVSPTRVTAIVPAGMPPGSYALSVSNPDGGSGFLPSAYTVYANAAPEIDKVIPVQSASDLPVSVDIFGSNFAPGATALLGGPQAVPLNRLLHIDANHLRASLPPGLATGTYNLSVTNPGNWVATLSGAYTVRAATELDDLYAFDFDIFLQPHSANVGVATQLALNLRRQGGASRLSNIAVDFYDGDPQAGGTLLGRGMVNSISPGSMVSTTRVTWTPGRVGLHQLYAVIDPAGQVAENVEANNTIQHAITVYWLPADTTSPRVTALSIDQGADFTDNPLVTLNTTAEDNLGGTGVKSLLFVEYEYIKDRAGWVMTAISEWLPYETSWQDYPWMLTPAPGVHYIQAWAADWNGNISLLPASQPINYLPETVAILTGEIHTFRIHLSAGDRLQAALASMTGDADVYLFAPDGSLVGKSETGGWDNLSVVAPADGLYQIEVEAVIEATYRLALSLNGVGLPASRFPDEPYQPHPRGRVQPASDPGGAPEDGIGLPSPTVGYTIFLPLTMR